jgi:uncharacterized protein (UPF0262 family)
MKVERRTQRICHLELDENSIIKRNADIEHERRVAIFDLMENNRFVPQNDMPNNYLGPYHVILRMEDNRLAIDLKTEAGADLSTLVFPLSPLRRIIKEYFIVCDSYYDAIKSLHNDGSKILQLRFEDKVDIDFETARRLFTLICVLQIR